MKRLSHSTAIHQRGLTLIELLVVTAIIVIISAVILANNNKYGGRVLLQNLAYDIALSIRQAQEYGISVRSSPSAASFKPGYGMYFNSAGSNNKSYILFADSNMNGLYDSGPVPPDETVSPSPYAIGRGFYIYKLCAPAGTLSCSSGSCTCINGGQEVNKLDIVYIRPEPDACITSGSTVSAQQVTDPVTGVVAEQCITSVSAPDARIIVTSPRGDFMSVVVSQNGQITVQ